MILWNDLELYAVPGEKEDFYEKYETHLWPLSRFGRNNDA